MHLISRSAMIAAALLTAAAPAMAQTTLTKPPALSAPTPPDTKDSYLKNAQDELGAWKRDLDAFAARAQASGEAASQATARQLGLAWDKAKVESDKLATATADGWDRTRSSFEAAARAFSETFNKSKAPPAAKP